MKARNLDTHVASNRIAYWLAQQLGAELIDSEESCGKRKFDWVVLVNGPFGFCDFRERVMELCEENENFVWVGNDIAINMPSQLKKILGPTKNVHHWVNHDNFKQQVNYRYINWNQLTYVPGIQWRHPKHNGVAYYGAWRDDRTDDFKKYLGRGVPYQVYISSSAKGLPEFKRLNPRLRAFKVANLIRDFAVFESTVYIEDEKSHHIYSSPANRFYECLSAGVVQFIDHRAVGTFARADIDISPYVVDGATDLQAKRMLINQMRAKQRKLYEKSKFDQALASDLKSAVAAVF